MRLLARFILFGVLLLPILGLAAPDEIVLASYNVENYLGPASEDEGATRRTRPKSDAAIEAIVRIIKEIHPDILGVCEMGRRDQFTKFQERLEEQGLHYSDSEFVD